MPDTREVLLHATAPPPSGASRPDAVERLAHLAVRTGVQNEFVTAPEKAGWRFMDDFITPVEQWCQAHAGQVSECYVATHERLPAVFVIGSNGGYDYSLGQPLAALETDLHRRGWNCFVLQVAGGSSHSAFFRPEEAIQVFPRCPQPSHAQCG